MKRLLAALVSLFRQPADEVLDHVPVQRGNVAAKKIQRARERAAQRHGKPFATDVIKPRETPPSRDLVELQKRAQPAGNVSEIGQKRKSR